MNNDSDRENENENENGRYRVVASFGTVPTYRLER